MHRTHAEMKCDKMFWNGREYGEAVHLADKEEMKGEISFYAAMKLKAGEEIGYHQHVGEKELFHFLQGEGEINDNGKVVKVSPGDVIMTPADGWHAFKNTGAGDLVFTALIIKTQRKPA